MGNSFKFVYLQQLLRMLPEYFCTKCYITLSVVMCSFVTTPQSFFDMMISVFHNVNNYHAGHLFIFIFSLFIIVALYMHID